MCTDIRSDSAWPTTPECRRHKALRGYSRQMIDAGLCATCTHARRNETRRGTVYVRCLLAADDPQFAKYPRLPVLSCPGYQPVRAEPRQ